MRHFECFIYFKINMSYVAGNTLDTTNNFLQSIYRSFLGEVNFYGDVFGISRVAGVFNRRRATRRHRACRHKRYWSRNLYFYIRLQARHSADRRYVDDFGGRNLRGISADFGRLNRHAQVRGKISAQQPQARHNSRAADNVVFNGFMRHGARRLHNVPDYLRHSD